jgi:hypothetical protein
MGSTSASVCLLQPKSHPLCDRIPGVLWPWPELVLPGGREGSAEGIEPLVSHFVQQSRRGRWCRQNIPLMRDFRALVLKEMYFPRGLGKGQRQQARGFVPPSQPAFRGWPPHHQSETGTGMGPCLRRKIERFLIMCIAPIMCFFWSVLVSPEFFIAVPHADFTRVHGDHWRPFGTQPGGEVAFWAVLSRTSTSLQDCVITRTDTVTGVSQRSLFGTDLRSLRICKQGSKQDIFLPCIQ